MIMQYHLQIIWDTMFFLFNPFDADIYQKVIDKVLDTFTQAREDEHAYIICYGQTITDYIASKKVVKKLCAYHDQTRETGCVIWQWQRLNFQTKENSYYNGQ